MKTSVLDQATGRDWMLYQGDCVQVAPGIPSDSVHLSVYSPPFSSTYIYSDSEADMGNCVSDDEFFQHFGYLIPELLRITVPGRLCAVHCKDLPRYQNAHGAAGLYDFPGALVRAFEGGELYDLRAARAALLRLHHDTTAVDVAITELEAQQRADGAWWQFHSRVTIWKDPVIEAARTNNHGLLFKNFSARAEVCRQGMADYMLMFRKHTPEMPDQQVQQRRKPGDYIGEQPPRFFDDDRDYAIQVWQRYASPVWFDIDQTRVLNFQIARDNQDEKHLCPLQLDVIDRCIDLWTMPGEVVFDPFNGVGSTGYEALKMNRRYIGIELKRSYFDLAIRHLQDAERAKDQLDMFAGLPMASEVA
jgi:hypothetical protein